MTAPLRRSPLHDRHTALGAKFAAFSGWEMPLEYPGGGVLKEHTAVREEAGVFDVSHLGKATVRGPGAVSFLNRCLTNDLDRISAGQAQYTMCCDDTSGGVVDDLMLYRFSDSHAFLVPNASNSTEVVRRLTRSAPLGVAVIDQHREYSVIAVQGPRSAQVLSAVGLPSGHAYMSFTVANYAGAVVVVCRTGYTGEHGYELVVPSASAGPLWDAVVATGVQPCGLGARDTLRTEMGYPLHGQDLSMHITPVQAGAGWAVGWSKRAFWGRTALLREKESGPREKLWGIESLDRSIPRPGMIVLVNAVPAGEITSGTFSPTRKVGIGLALLREDYGWHAGTRVEVDVRGRRAPMKVVKPPFVPSRVKEAVR